MIPFLNLIANRRRASARTVGDVLGELGLTADEIASAEADGTAEMLVLDGLILPERERFSIDQLATHAKLDVEVVRDVWRAMGFADPPGDERVFTERDAAVLRRFGDAVEQGLIEPERTMQLVRVLGVSMATFATAVVDTVEERTAERRRAAGELDSGDDVEEDAGSLAARVADLLPLMTDALDYSFRRHVKSAARRRLAVAAAMGGEREVVGFTDLVKFSKLADELDHRALSRVMDRFDSITHDVVVRYGGRIVKMIGDECMFSIIDPAEAARAAVEMSQTFTSDDALPAVRIGLAYGEVLSRDGDLYGPVVNLASRLVALGAPGAIHISRELREAISGLPEFELRYVGVRRLKHIGNRRVYRLRARSRPRVDDASDRSDAGDAGAASVAIRS